MANDPILIGSWRFRTVLALTLIALMTVRPEAAPLTLAIGAGLGVLAALPAFFGRTPTVPAV